jgi:WD repeat-containing protein 68
MSNPSFDSPRRSAVFARQPEELHMPSTGLVNPNLSRQPPSHEFPTTPDTGAGATQVPSINVQPSSQSLQYGTGGGNSNNNLPGALTPGGQNRPQVVSANTAPSVIPTLQSSQQPNHRSSMINSHGHSRSSPAGIDPSMYKQHGAPEEPRYPTSPGAGFPPQTPQGSKYSPLGLADVRLPGDHYLGGSLMSPGAAAYNSDNQVPSNSNYIAPWPIYAVDWCKWPISGNSSSFGGKLALGSHLEDNHNYVRNLCWPERRC